MWANLPVWPQRVHLWDWRIGQVTKPSSSWKSRNIIVNSTVIVCWRSLWLYFLDFWQKKLSQNTNLKIVSGVKPAEPPSPHRVKVYLAVLPAKSTTHRRCLLQRFLDNCCSAIPCLCPDNTRLKKQEHNHSKGSFKASSKEGPGTYHCEMLWIEMPHSFWQIGVWGFFFFLEKIETPNLYSTVRRTSLVSWKLTVVTSVPS